jgi:SAM-dependent methyltransferase
VKCHAPAAARNRDPIASVLAQELPASGLVLEIASGTGEHAAHFAGRFPHLLWQPSDPDPTALASIDAWRAEAALGNLLPPIALDAAATHWPVDRADAIVCINMVHISPPASAEGLIAGAGRLLPEGAPLVLYGPFREDGVDLAPSNASFDRSLRAQDERWGLRRAEWIDELAGRAGLRRHRRVEMPANNLTLVYRREAGLWNADGSEISP